MVGADDACRVKKVLILIFHFWSLPIVVEWEKMPEEHSLLDYSHREKKKSDGKINGGNGLVSCTSSKLLSDALST